MLHVALVLSFITGMTAASFDEDPALRHNGARIGVGQTVGYVQETTLSFGVEYERWELQAMQQGNAREHTAEGTVKAFSLARVIRPAWGHSRWQPYFKIGPAYVENSPFVGRTNMLLGFGVEWRDTLTLGFNHYSSAGVHHPNTGVDDIRLGFNVAF